MLSGRSGGGRGASAARPAKIVTAQHNDYTGQDNVTFQASESPVKFLKAVFILSQPLPPRTSMSHTQGVLTSMTARIFKPAKNAMQSGTAKTREWQLDYEPEQPRAIEPLMGWTSSGDMKQQLTLRFDSKEEAVAYCEREGTPGQVNEPNEPFRRQAAYADNFAFRRGEPWTH
jgi:hypothetical protein